MALDALAARGIFNQGPCDWFLWKWIVFFRLFYLLHTATVKGKPGMMWGVLVFVFLRGLIWMECPMLVESRTAEK